MTTHRPERSVSLGSAFTVNIGSGPDDKKIDALLRLIVTFGATVIGMQEGSDRVKMLTRLVELLRHPARVARRIRERRAARKRIRKALAERGFKVWQPLTIPGAPAVPITYDSSVWRLRRGKSIVAVARRWVGAVGAGPTFAKPKILNFIVLESRETGEVIEFGDTHLIPSSTRSNLPEREEKARRDHYRDHIDVLVRWIRRARKRGHGVVLFADLNATPGYVLLEPLHDVGMTGWTARGTHGARPIDHVLTLDVDADVAQVIPLPGFDHHVVGRKLHSRRPRRAAA